MQNTKSSKSLSATIASATFRATRLGATHLYEDILLLELISCHDTLCYQLLSGHLNPAQLEELRIKIDRIVSAPHAPTELSESGVTPEIFYSDMVERIALHYPEAERLSTIHALHFIVCDSSTIAASTLAHFGLTLPVLERVISEYSFQNGLQPPRAVVIPPPHRREAAHPLSKFGVDLTERAQRGEIDPVIGREVETERLIEILARRKKNNPILVGEAGVGKSAIVEGLALRIASGDVPQKIQNKRLFSLDISALVAGTKFRGEFEERMQRLLSAIIASGDSIIFIDEIHTIVGAGSTQGSLDTANILKPALARGDIQTIGATTTDEYRTHIEADSALERRFQRIGVEPTNVEQSIEIVRRVAQHYEEHHNVIYSDEAITSCVTLSDRYISDRHLPDKAIDLMDEAGAHAALGCSDGRVAIVKRGDIERLITVSTGIPAEQLSGNEIRRLQQLESHLNSRVIGQSRAVAQLSSSILRSRSGLSDEGRPIGVFMLVGPTGVGKTHLAKELSKWIFGDRSRNLIRIDMSEYGEAHSVSRLIGSPPGYVGYGEGGELSEAARRNPYSVILLDEIEKAHSDIFNLMLQIFDEGRLTDGMGRVVDLRNTIIIMTSNVGSRELSLRRTPIGYGTSSKGEQIRQTPKECYHKALEGRFSPEFLNRVDEILLFEELTQEHIERIVERELSVIFDRVERRGYRIRSTPAARHELASLGYQSKYGARELKRTLRRWVEDPLSRLIIDAEIPPGAEIVIERCRGGEGVKLRVS